MKCTGFFKYVKMTYKGFAATNSGTMNASIDYAGSADELEFADWINLSSYSASHGVYDQTEKTVNLEIKGNRVWLLTRASTFRNDWGGSWVMYLNELEFYNE